MPENTPNPNIQSPLPTDPQERAILFCDTAESGDAASLQHLLTNGFSPHPYWSPEIAAARAADFRDYMRQNEHTLDILNDSRELMALLPESTVDYTEAWKSQAAARYAPTTAPYSHEIPLFLAAESGNADCVRILIQAGADPLIRDENKDSAMHYATSVAVVQLLQSHGLDINDPSADSPPLASAVTLASLDKVRALLAAGAQVPSTRYGIPYFHCAVSPYRNLDILKLLVAAGADPLALSATGRNAIHAAINPDGPRESEEQLHALYSYLISLGLDINHKSYHGHTPLADALLDGTPTEVRVLCQLGADPNGLAPVPPFRGSEGPPILRPLIFLAINQARTNPDLVTAALLESGANPRSTDYKGLYPVSHAVVKLCEHLPNTADLYAQLRHQLSALNPTPPTPSQPRADFIAQTTAFFRPTVEAAVNAIPYTDDEQQLNQFNTKLREIIARRAHIYSPAHFDLPRSDREKAINLITTTAAYHAWDFFTNPETPPTAQPEHQSPTP